MTPEERQAEFDKRANQFLGEVAALETLHNLRLVAGCGPYGLDLSVQDPSKDGLWRNIGEGIPSGRTKEPQ